MSALLPTHQEIQYNLDILEAALKNGTTVDPGFIEILADDAAQLAASHPSEIKHSLTLTARIERLAGPLYDTLEHQLVPKSAAGQVRPLVGDKKPIAAIASQYCAGPVKQGLERLEQQGFSMRSIAGDGHCLFRSIAFLIVEFLSTAKVEERHAFFNALHQTVHALATRDPALRAKYDAFAKTVNTWCEGRAHILELLRDGRASDSIVGFLRHLAVACNRQHANEVYRSEAISTSGSVAQYEHDMIDMQRAAIGGHVEIAALARALGMNFQVLDVKAIGQEQELMPERLLFSGSGARQVDYLLFRPGHYDVACAPRRANS